MSITLREWAKLAVEYPAFRRGKLWGPGQLEANVGIRNRNIDANAKIAMSKIDQAFGDRVFFEDFDDDNGAAINTTYGFIFATDDDATATHASASSSCSIATNDATGLVVGVPTYSDAKSPVFRARITTSAALTDWEIQIGFGDVDATDAHGDPIGDKNVAYWEFDDTTSDTWRLRTQKEGGGASFSDVDTGITVVGNTAYNLEIQLIGGLVKGKINDEEFVTAADAITSGTTDWRAMARAQSQDAVARTLLIDTWYTSSER